MGGLHPSLRPGTSSGASLRLAGNQLAGVAPRACHALSTPPRHAEEQTVSKIRQVPPAPATSHRHHFATAQADVPTAHSYVFLILEGQLCFDEVKLPSWQVLGLKGRFPRFWGYIIP